MQNKINPEEISFQKSYDVSIKLPYNGDEICLTILDDLEAAHEELTESYKNKICSFINNGHEWFNKCLNEIKTYGKNTFDYDSGIDDVKLLNIFILFEQDQPALYGLAYWTAFDIEHGGGLKIDEGYEICKIGDQDSSSNPYC